MNGSETDKATYTFEEAIERIRICNDKDELRILASVLEEEKREYSLYHLLIISYAVSIRFQH